MADNTPENNPAASTTQAVETPNQSDAAANIEKLRATLLETEGLKAKLEELNASKAEIEAQQKKLKAALADTDKLTTNIDTIKTFAKEITAAKDESSSNSETIKADIAIVTDLKNKIDKLYKDSAVAADELAFEQKDLKNAIQALAAKKQELETLVNELTGIKTSAGTDKESVLADVQAISQTKTQFEDLKNQAQSTYDSLVSRQSEISGKVTEFTGMYDRAKEQFAELFEGKKNEDGTLTEKAINDQVRELFSDLKAKLDETQKINQKATEDLGTLRGNTETEFATLKETLKGEFDGLLAEEKARLASAAASTGDQFEQLKKTLEAEIHSLLPDAGSAGLASAYFEAKSKYSPTKYAVKAGVEVKWWQPIFHFIGGAAAPAFFYVMLLAPLIFLAHHMIILFDWLKDHPADMTPGLLFIRAIISLPLVAISYFGWNSISLYRGMYEEYNHKQRVLQLYHGFKEEVSQHGGEEEQQKLLSIMLRTVADKPKLAIHKGDKGFGDLLRGVLPSSGAAAVLDEIRNLLKNSADK